MAEPDYLNRRVDLDQLFTCLHVINTIEACQAHLSTLAMADKVLLIISGSLGDTILSLVHEKTQIVSVFIFCDDSIKHKEWAGKYSKVRGVFNVAEQLVEAVQRDAQLLMHHFVPANIFTMQDVHQTSFQNIDKDQANFMWFQLLIDVLSRLPQSEQGKKELIEECRRCYAKNEPELKKIAEFEASYTTDHAIRWYTRDCFLFRLINRAFRTRNIDNIFKFRYYFVDLQQQLDHLYQLQKKELSLETVYRGQIISADEFRKLKHNKGGIYSVNTFLSTTTKSDVALSFNSGAFVRPYFECVLFQIKFENKNDKPLKTSFAKIQDVSYNQHESEVLFNMGSVFRIGNVEAWTDDFWVIELTLIEQTGIDESLREYFLKKYVGERSTLLVMSSFLGYMKEYTRAKQFCELLLKEDSISNIAKMQAYSDLGYYQYQTGDLDSAESSAQLSCQLQLTTDTFAPATYSLLGLIAGARHHYRRALQYHQVAVDTVRSRKLEENESIAFLYSNLGMAWKDLHQAIPALYWCEQIALPCQLKLLPSNHPDLLITFTNIAEIYNSIGNYVKARNYYKQSLEIQKQILPQNHKDVASTLLGLSLVCQSMGEYQDALDYLSQSQQIVLNSSSHNHTDLVSTYLGFAAVYELLEKDKKAFFYYKKATQGLSQKNSEHRTQLATTWNNIGFLLLQKKQYKSAMIYFFKALTLERKFLPVRATLGLTTLSNIGMVYQELGLLKRALFYHRYVLTKRKTYLRPRDPGLATTWDNIGAVLCKAGQCRKAIVYHQRALTSYVLNLPLDHLVTTCVCEHLGDAYRLLGNKRKAKQYYNEPERMARGHLRKVEKYRNKEIESDEDMIIHKRR
ncbi:unnamed protein product [Adineta steineri]|uniref:NAD(P)(+)--arginine ADP-ribosyltransferase n=1 Tax=Adineta steineri TaxID=433720 RepID=A0A815S3P8_9BILA|nr:unnamed protein product [Adineta steineri]CAF1484992.1 unnamed protein product [Adineta steineri]CAF1485030.1 unnamed protein product [Adineta steineri]CAF1558368.1 unnamed protein product [Adineta steineri]CAF1639641.1 unnamed protein product [Adineta steineri]